MYKYLAEPLEGKMGQRERNNTAVVTTSKLLWKEKTHPPADLNL